MVFKKKKKLAPQEELVAVKIEELKSRLEELQKAKAPQPEPKPAPQIVQPKVGEFNLNLSEMSLAVNALASSQEFKVYEQMVLGQQIAKIIQGYNAVVKKMQEQQPTEEEEDVDEEQEEEPEQELVNEDEEELPRG